MTTPTALITGATSGIGAAAAIAFAKKGWNVALAGRRQDKGELVAQQVEDAGGKALFVQTDVSDDSAVADFVGATVDTFGGIATAINNAGIEGDLFTPVHQQSVENYQHVFDVNVKAVLTSMKAEIPALLAGGGGSIVNVSSIAGVLGFPGMSVYTATKHAVVGLTKNAALEYAKEGIRVNAVAPGPIETEMYDRFANDDEVKQQINAMVPMGRAGTVEEVAHAILWLSDPENTYTTGQVLAVDGGYTAQ